MWPSSLDEIPNFDLPEWSDLAARSVTVPSPWMDRLPKGPIRSDCNECISQNLDCEGPPCCQKCAEKGIECNFSLIDEPEKQPTATAGEKPKATSGEKKDASAHASTTTSSTTDKVNATGASDAIPPAKEDEQKE